MEPAGTGQPPSSPKLDSKLVQPARERGVCVGQSLPAGVVEVRGDLDPGQPLDGGGEELLDIGGVGHTGGVAETDLGGAGGSELLGEVEHPFIGTLPSNGQP